MTNSTRIASTRDADSKVKSLWTWDTQVLEVTPFTTVSSQCGQSMPTTASSWTIINSDIITASSYLGAYERDHEQSVHINMCGTTEETYFAVTITEASLLGLGALLCIAWFIYACAKAYCIPAEPDDKIPGAFSRLMWSIVRQAFFLAAFATCFAYLHIKHTWNYYHNKCPSSGGWDNTSVDSMTILLCFIAVTMFAVPAFLSLVRLHVGTRKMWVLLFIVGMLLSGLFCLMLLIWNWYDPASVFAKNSTTKAIVDHLSSGLYHVFVIFSCIMGEVRHNVEFRTGDVAASALRRPPRTTERRRLLRPSAGDVTPADDCCDCYHFSASGRCFNAAAMVLIVLRLICLFAFAAAWQMSYDLAPSGDPFNFNSSYQIGYNLVAIGFVVLVLLNMFILLLQVMSIKNASAAFTAVIAQSNLEMARQRLAASPMMIM